MKAAAGEDADRLVDEIAAIIGSRGGSVATAESLTGGQLAAALAAGEEAGEWFRGGVVAYHPTVKYEVLGAPRGPVVTALTASAMARTTARLLGAEYAVAITGVGGPDSQEGKPSGTVFFATWAAGRDTLVEHHRFDGEPVEVMEQTIRQALKLLLGRILRHPT